MAKKAKANAETGANIGFDASLGITAAKLLAGQGDYAGANPDDLDGYKAENVFWVTADARSSRQQISAKQFTLGPARLTETSQAVEPGNDLEGPTRHARQPGLPVAAVPPHRKPAKGYRLSRASGHGKLTTMATRPVSNNT